MIIIQTDKQQLMAVQRTDLDIDSPEGRGLAYADNRVGELSLSWDAEQVLADLQAGVNLDEFWRKDELDELLADLTPKPTGDTEPQTDRAEELRQQWGVQPGQLWQLGEHRVACGDCTDAATVARVMGGEQARLIATSPPYSDQREYKLGSFDWFALMIGCTNAYLPVCGNPADVVVNLGMSHVNGRVDFYWNDWLDHCAAAGHPLYGMYVWDKGNGFPGEWNGRLAPAHEFVFHFSIGHKSANKWIKTSGESARRGASGKRFRQKDGSLNEVTSPDKIGQPYKVPDSVIRVGREMARGIHTESHPAVFPPEFVEFLIRTWSGDGAIVYEPFSGSGTTIIACENLGRRARACEISPAYVAVALERWSVHTGRQPVLVDI
jgi:DNA modification methylase